MTEQREPTDSQRVAEGPVPVSAASVPGTWNLDAQTQTLKGELTASLTAWRDGVEPGVSETEVRAGDVRDRGSAWRASHAVWQQSLVPGSAFHDGLDEWVQRLRKEQEDIERRIVVPSFSELQRATADAEQEFGRAGAPSDNVEAANGGAAALVASVFDAVREAQAVRVATEESLDEGCRDAAGRIRALGQFPSP
jgi:hypothetical protein